jgi:acyl-CoA synthetase (NDP forming)
LRPFVRPRARRFVFIGEANNVASPTRRHGTVRPLREDGLDLEASKRKVAALTAPRNVVLVGASDRAGSWAARVWRNLNRYQFPGPIHLVNPRRSEIWERPCYPDFKSLPEAPDHLVVLVPAAGVAETLRSGAAAGARAAPRCSRRASAKPSTAKPRRSAASWRR